MPNETETHQGQHHNPNAVHANGNGAVEKEAAEISGKGSEHVKKLLTLTSPHVRVIEESFHFKTTKEEIETPEGKETKEKKRPTVKLQLAVPTFEGLVEAMADEKIQNYVLDLLKEDVVQAAREQVNEDESISQTTIDLTKLTLAALASRPPAARRGGGIAKETWELFTKDYVEVMPAITGKSSENCATAAKLLAQKFQPVKTNKELIKLLKERMSLWFANSPRAEELSECYEFLEKKADEFMNADNTELLAKL